MDIHTQKELDMSKKVVGIRGLIGLLAIIVVVVIAVLVGGLLLLPKITEMLTEGNRAQNQVEVVQEETSPKKEPESIVEPDPNTRFASLGEDIFVKCGKGEGKGKEISLFLPSKISCTVRTDQEETKFLASPDEEYVCLTKEAFQCLTKIEYEQQKERSKVSKKPTSKPKAPTKKQKAKIDNNLKNEEELTVQGPAMVTIGSDLEAMIYIDGKKMRKSPLFKHSISPGKHTVIIVPVADPRRKHKFTIETESGVGYIRKWSFEQGLWLKKIP